MAPVASPSGLDAIYGAPAADSVRAANVLVVGAGGVGCELVKNLGVTGFGTVTLIDLDTIDVSNLNRQFLFRKTHVGNFKAEVAAEAVIAMVPNFVVNGIVGNVRDARFDVDYFAKFDVICNALDNLEARRHVNRMCLAARVPLIESGSTGYNGQVTVIGGGTECYDCSPKPAPRTYAVCTIRSTPEKPVHCVVWAKHLWDLVFGADDDSNVLRDLDDVESVPGIVDDSMTVSSPITNENRESDNRDRRETDQNVPRLQEDSKPRQRVKRLRFEVGEDSETFARRVCDRVFIDDINAHIAMRSLWDKEERPPPTPCDVSTAAAGQVVDLANIDLVGQRIWSRQESAAVFQKILEHVVVHRANEIGKLSFDKDDPDALAFVVAAANLRASAYGLELQSPFMVKGIAGNIVHAIATTNAMVAGLIVLEAIKIVVHGGVSPSSLTTFVRRTPTGTIGRRRALLCTEPLSERNPRCYVCSKGMLSLSIDVKTSSLRTLVNAVCKQALGVVEPIISVTSGDFFNTLFECGQGLEEDEIELYQNNLDKLLCDLHVQSGCQIGVQDSSQNFDCELYVRHVPSLFAEKPESDRFEISGDVPEPQGLSNNSGAQSDSPKIRDDSGHDDLEEVTSFSDSSKKQSSLGKYVGGGVLATKRARAENLICANSAADDEVVEITSLSAGNVLPSGPLRAAENLDPPTKKQKVSDTSTRENGNCECVHDVSANGDAGDRHS